eukprot:jgi/Antlo1/1375/1218
MNSEYKYLFKMVLIGDSGVGKTSFMKRYTDHVFIQDYISTIGVDFKIKTITVDGEEVKLQLWDTAGQERFSAITKSYYRGAHGIIVIFDLCNRSSFVSVKNWLKKIDENASPDCEVIILGNKVDVAEGIDVSEDEVNRFLEERGIKKERFYKVSAKENIRVDCVFENLAKILVDKTKKTGPIMLKDKKALFDLSSGPRRTGCC